jgi:uncharacterized protein YcfL
MNHTLRSFGLGRIAAALAFVALSAAAACNSVTAVNTVEPADMKAVPQSIYIKKVNFDASLAGGARVSNAYEGRTPAGALRVQLNVDNNSSGGETDFMWKCEWFDNTGMAIAGQNPQWTKVILLPGQATTISIIAPTPNAVDWRVSMTKWQRS